MGVQPDLALRDCNPVTMSASIIRTYCGIAANRRSGPQPNMANFIRSPHRRGRANEDGTSSPSAFLGLIADSYLAGA
jgi:hypothetical protein